MDMQALQLLWTPSWRVTSMHCIVGHECPIELDLEGDGKSMRTSCVDRSLQSTCLLTVKTAF